MLCTYILINSLFLNILYYYRSLNIEKWPVLMKNKIPSTSIETKHNYKINQIVVFLNNISVDNTIISKFCNQFNIKHIK